MENFDFTKTPEDKEETKKKEINEQEIERELEEMYKNLKPNKEITEKAKRELRECEEKIDKEIEEKEKATEQYVLEMEIEVKKAVHVLIKRFIDKIGISLSEDDYPEVYFDTEHSKQKIISGSSFNYLDNVITINIMDLDNKDTFAEEISHFIRFKLKPADEEYDYNVEEFFGYLGRKILFPKIKRKPLFDSNRQVYERYVGKLEQIISIENLEIIKKRRVEILLTAVLRHFYGYKYADLVSIEDVKDWQKLFSMSNSDVRKEFFVSESQNG